MRNGYPRVSTGLAVGRDGNKDVGIQHEVDLGDRDKQWIGKGGNGVPGRTAGDNFIFGDYGVCEIKTLGEGI